LQFHFLIYIVVLLVREKAKTLLDQLSSDEILRDMRADARRLKERIKDGVG
jgi:hypothetical protein